MAAKSTKCRTENKKRQILRTIDKELYLRLNVEENNNKKRLSVVNKGKVNCMIKDKKIKQ